MRLVAISADTIEDSVVFANKLGLTFPLLSDTELAAALAFGVAMKGEEIAVPSVFVINSKKRITFSQVGESIMERVGAKTLLEEAEKAK